jgi:hypothetical protein
MRHVRLADGRRIPHSRQMGGFGTILVLQFLISGVGFLSLSYGKKMERMPYVVFGLLLLIYPYFISDPLILTIVALVLGAGLWVYLQREGRIDSDS